ncbi:MAG: hypothetical protein R2942_05700 [Ignavibacteria bacterium]
MNIQRRWNSERAAFIRDRLNDIIKVMSYQKVITSAINDKKIIIKCDNETEKRYSLYRMSW